VSDKGSSLGALVGRKIKTPPNPNEEYWRRALAGQGEIKADPGPDTTGGRIYRRLGQAVGAVKGIGQSERDKSRHANEAEETFRTVGELALGPEAIERSGRNIREGDADALDYVNVGLVVAPSLLRKPAGLAVRRLSRNLEGTAAKRGMQTARRVLTESRLPEGATPKGAPLTGPAPGMTPREAALPYERVHPGSPYLRKQEGPYLVVKREGALPQIVPEARGASLPQIRELLADPANNQPLRLADAYTREHFGRPYVPGQDPGSSLAKQGAIGRAYQMAVENTPGYKHSVFERYGQMFPEEVERAGAQNYDQLTEAAYNQLADETHRQFQLLPVEMRFHEGVGEYPTPSAMMGDVLGNGRLNVFQGGEPHPYLSTPDPDTGLIPNEEFRAAHDYFGHVLPGSTFRAGGEEIAYGSHAQMMSPLARAALAAETRGQNSLVNYSPLNAKLTYEMNRVRDEIAQINLLAKMRGRKADPRELEPLNAQLRELGATTHFAPQVPLLLPPEMLAPDFAGGMPGYLQPINRPRLALPEQRGVHLSTTPGLSQTDPSFYGTGHRGVDFRTGTGGDGRGGGQTSFYLGPPGTVQPEPMIEDIAKQAYEARLRGLYDMREDPEQLALLAKAYNLKGERMAREKGTAYVPDFARLLRDYGYSGYKNPNFFANDGAANVFDPVDVTPIEKGPEGYAEGGAVSVPVPGAVSLPVPEAA